MPADDRSYSSTRKLDQELDSALEDVYKLLEDIESDLTKVTMLEMLYLSVFTNTSKIKLSERSGDRTSPIDIPPNIGHTELSVHESELLKAIEHTYTHPECVNTTPQYLCGSALVGGLLELIEKCLQNLRRSHSQIPNVEANNGGNGSLAPGYTLDSNADVADAKGIACRLNKMSQLVSEAHVRFTLVNSIPNSMTTKNTSFMARMTAAPTTLLTYCVRAGDYSQCEEIIRFFSLQDQPQAQEALLAKLLDDLRANTQGTCDADDAISAFGTLLSGLPQEVFFYDECGYGDHYPLTYSLSHVSC
jgi:hypothetical protein